MWAAAVCGFVVGAAVCNIIWMTLTMDEIPRKERHAV